MDIFSIFTLLGGLAFFLFGMETMSSSLKKMAGGKLQQALKKMTANPFASLGIGAGITILIQSSSALTVMLVGLVNSGLMHFGQTIGVIMGSNIGTTFTAWVLSLDQLDTGNNMFLAMLKPENFSPLLALVGIILIMVDKGEKKKDIGSIMVGFTILMFGMELMGDSVAPLKDMPEFASILTAFENPFLGVVVGAVLTGIIQSSAASIGILMTLAGTGSITFEMAIPIIMGQNIGTCVTALLSSIGANKNARRVSAIHVSFNVIGTVICLSLFYLVNAIVGIPFMEDAITPVYIATVHTIFNVFTTIVLLPFSKKLEKLAVILVPEDENIDKNSFIDDRLLNTPAFAIGECDGIVNNMGELAKSAILDAISLFKEYNDDLAEKILLNEDELDRYEDELGTFLVKLSSCELSLEDSKKVSKHLHVIGDFERIGDHAVNLLKTAEEIKDKKLSFSDEAKRELAILTDAVKEIIDLTISAYWKEDCDLAKKVEPLEEVIDELSLAIKSFHVDRLQAGNCTIEMGFILSDLLTNCERVSDHCSNIAVAIIELGMGSFETHQYLQEIKYFNSESYKKEHEAYGKEYEEYTKKYMFKMQENA